MTAFAARVALSIC